MPGCPLWCPKVGALPVPCGVSDIPMGPVVYQSNCSSSLMCGIICSAKVDCGVPPLLMLLNNSTKNTPQWTTHDNTSSKFSWTPCPSRKPNDIIPFCSLPLVQWDLVHQVLEMLLFPHCPRGIVNCHGVVFQLSDARVIVRHHPRVITMIKKL